MKILEYMLLGLLILIPLLMLSGLIIWGIGLFVIWAFKISFIMTYWQGLAIALILFAVGGINVNIKE